MGEVFIPALAQSERWGELKGAEGQAAKEAFLGRLSSFVAVLSNARASIADTVQLSQCSHPVLSSLSSSADVLSASTSTELVEAAEACVQKWCKEIEQASEVLVQGDIVLYLITVTLVQQLSIVSLVCNNIIV